MTRRLSALAVVIVAAHLQVGCVAYRAEVAGTDGRVVQASATARGVTTFERTLPDGEVVKVTVDTAQVTLLDRVRTMATDFFRFLGRKVDSVQPEISTQ